MTLIKKTARVTVRQAIGCQYIALPQHTCGSSPLTLETCTNLWQTVHVPAPAHQCRGSSMKVLLIPAIAVIICLFYYFLFVFQEVAPILLLTTHSASKISYFVNDGV